MMGTAEKRKMPGQRAGVLGLGVSGWAAVKFLVAEGIEVSVSDSRTFEELSPMDRDYLLENKISFEGGGHSEEFLAVNDFLFVSPGIPTDLPLLKKMEEGGIPLLGELALAAPYLTERVVAVTGTNGKTTVTALIGELLAASGRKVFVGGNIGTPLLDYLRGRQRVDYLVLELSSFQLELAGDFAPHIGVLLNISPDHLDRHGSMEEYAAAKMKIFAGQGKGDKAIICDDELLLSRVRKQLSGQELYCFGDAGSDCAARGSGSSFSVSLKAEREESYSLSGTRLDSHTGRLNSEAAVLVASLLGCDRGAIEKGLHTFSPAAHRLQYVGEIGGVEFYDDSKATNTGAVLSALASFSGNIILLAGGREKGEDFAVLKESVREKVKECIVIGEAADAIASALGDITSIRRADSMAGAVDLAVSLATPGDVVLLAPGCSSFDMFANYGQRGEVFTQAVMGLGELTGERVPQ